MRGLNLIAAFWVFSVALQLQPPSPPTGFERNFPTA
jgi:hypothetical protein